MVKLDTKWLDDFHRLGAKPGEEYGAAPARKLSMLLRPAFIARPRKTLVWGDWSNIEARVLPWLADSEGAEAKLDIFRAVDKDPKLPDVYMRTAADLLEENADQLWEDYGRKDDSVAYQHAYSVRQSHGKVPELSLGFGGGLGALQAMATNYGVYLDTKVAKAVVARWREVNQWAVDFWGKHDRRQSYGIWGAINSAMTNPDAPYQAGRVVYVYDRGYLNGTLFCFLPDGKMLTYPSIKWEWREVENKTTKEKEDRYQLTYIKGYARVAGWYGKFAENITQAYAVRVLKRTLRTLDDPNAWVRNPDGSSRRYSDFMPCVMHTHDEVVTEVHESHAEQAARELHALMIKNSEHDAGLPLAAEITTNWYYTKGKF